MLKRALISVSDKTGIIQFAKELAKLKIEIYSTGNTAKLLKKHKIPVKTIEGFTGFPEILDGRVKTLHPKIYAGILALRNKKEHQRQVKKLGAKFFDLVVVNLYPFEKENTLEQIDIGGVSLLRAASKNYQNIAVVCDARDYPIILNEIKKQGDISVEFKAQLAFKAFYRVSLYDEAIANYFSKIASGPAYLNLHYVKTAALRYGENPHQRAELYRELGNRDSNIVNARKLNGKELSFNNILDADSSLKLVMEFDKPAAVFIKHNNPCGVASAKTIEKAFDLSYRCDTKSAFGGVVALNRECGGEIAKYIIDNKIFLEVIIAPSFSGKSLNILKTKPNLRLLVCKACEDVTLDFKKISGGVLVQTPNTRIVTAKDLKIVTKKKPAKLEIRAMLFANKIVKHVMSNSVVFAKSKEDIDVVTGIGAGQMSRVDSVFIAHHKAGKSAKNSVMASDAFFPFPDAVLEAKKAGIRAIIQPGGSVRDEEIIKTADKCGISMVFTGIRMFRH